MAVSETNVRNGKGRGPVSPLAMARVTRQTSPLTYRGYPAQELCWRQSFEEVAFLLWHGELPTRDQLLAQQRAERSWRAIQPDLAAALAGQPLDADPMDTLRKAVTALGANAPAAQGPAPYGRATAAVQAEALRLFAVLPSLVAFDQRRRRGLGAVAARDDLGYAANFLYMTFGKVPEPQVVAAFERSLILHAGDGFGLSPLATRIGTTSAPVLYAAVAAAAGALKASPQGTAAAAALGILNEGVVHGNARSWAEEAVATGRCVAGFGTADAKAADNRVPAMRTVLGMVAALRGGQRLLAAYDALAGAVGDVSGLRPSLDLPTGPAYHLIGFDAQMFAPVLFAARIPGLTAHLAGQPGVNGIVSPRSSYDDQKRRLPGRRGVKRGHTMAQLGERTSRWPDWPARRLAARKRELGTTVSVVIPARNEESTVGEVVSRIAKLAAETGLVDELVVMDSDSTDNTSEAATRAGAVVHRARDVAPQLDAFPGKGEALWKSLLVTKGDLLVFVDADLTHWGPHFVTGLLGPLLFDPHVMLVKGFYERLYSGRDGSVTADGGRVTELIARPLLSLWWPELAGIVQPLAGEWAARRELMESLPIPVGYGIELAVLLDTGKEHGLEAIAQVDLGSRGHKHQASHDLAVMAAELLLVAERRRPLTGPVPGPVPEHGHGEREVADPVLLHQFVRTGGELRQTARPVPTHERPPARLVTRTP